MKKYLIYIVSFLQCQISFGQLFGLLEKNPQQLYSTLVREPRDGNYRVSNSRFPDITGASNKFQILKYNQNLQFVDSINFPRGISPTNCEPLRIGNRILWPSIMNDTLNNTTLQKTLILEFDLNYQLVNTFSLTTFENNPVLPTNMIYLAGRYYVCRSQVFGGPSYIYKLNGLFNKVDSVVYYGNTWVQEIHTIDNKLVIKGLNMPSPCGGASQGDKMIIDTNYAFISCTPVSSFGTPSFNSKIIPISKTKSLAVGYATSSSNSYQVLINTIFDQNNQIFQSKIFSYTGKNTRYVDYTNFAAVEQDRIVTVGCIGYDPLGNFAQPQKTKIFVNKLDTVGNIIWQKEHLGDMFYRPVSIVFTNDGGCLISGARYDTANAKYPNIMQSFLLKLDVNGEYLDVGIFENRKQILQGIRCFPNPSKDKIQFDIPFQENINISIYSTTGSEVISINDYVNLSEIDLSQLSQGCYFYSVQTQKSVYTGKIIHN